MIVTPDKYDAVLFDMDGVLTLTMKIHAAAWKRVFDHFLAERSAAHDESQPPFLLPDDYTVHVDGKLRYDGVRSFLAARAIVLPDGDPDDPPEAETVCGIGNRKDLLVKQVIADEGVELLPGAVAVVEKVRSLGIATAVVSASKNCELVLDNAGIRSLFDCIVDGNVAEQEALTGKPAPDTFLAAAARLNALPQRTVVVEDAISGVQAGRAGNFGLVIGIDHHDDPAILRDNGADIVIESLNEILDKH